MRKTNQDNFLIAEMEKSLSISEGSVSFGERKELSSGQRGQILAVADGMGGHAGGEHASRLTLEAVSEFVVNTLPWFYQADDLTEKEQADRLERAIERCQDRLAADQRTHPERTGMGTTLTLANVVWPQMHLVHIGDSRCYRLHEDDLTQLTVDHTFAQQMMDRNVAPEQIPGIWYHTLWNAIGGTDDRIEPSVQQCELELGDTLLLCTDGLTKHVDDDTIANVLKSGQSAKGACERLLRKANEAGGSDNTTVIVARFLAADDAVSEFDEAASVAPGPNPTADTVIHSPAPSK